MFEFFFHPTATAYGRRPKFVRAKLAATAEGKNSAYGPILILSFTVNDKIRMAKYSALLILALVDEILNHGSKNCLLYRSKRIKISSRDITDYI